MAQEIPPIYAPRYPSEFERVEVEDTIDDIIENAMNKRKEIDEHALHEFIRALGQQGTTAIAMIRRIAQEMHYRRVCDCQCNVARGQWKRIGVLILNWAETDDRPVVPWKRHSVVRSTASKIRRILVQRGILPDSEQLYRNEELKKTTLPSYLYHLEDIIRWTEEQIRLEQKT
jgi:hypothetical protein